MKAYFHKQKVQSIASTGKKFGKKIQRCHYRRKSLMLGDQHTHTIQVKCDCYLISILITPLNKII